MSDPPKQGGVVMTTGPEPEWVIEMREHYNRTGTYRGEDVRRVLGNPWERVDIPVGGNHELACVSNKAAD